MHRGSLLPSDLVRNAPEFGSDPQPMAFSGAPGGFAFRARASGMAARIPVERGETSQTALMAGQGDFRPFVARKTSGGNQ